MSCFALFVKPQPWLYAMALPFCVLINMLIVQIMQTMSFICLSPMRTCRLLADWRSNTIVLAAMCGRSAVGPRRPRVFQMFPSVKKTSPFHSYASGGAYSWWPRTRHTCFIRSLVEHWKCITKKFHFTDILTNIANSTIPKSKPRSKKRDPVWLNDECMNSIRSRRKATRKVKTCPTAANIENLRIIRAKTRRTINVNVNVNVNSRFV